MKTVRVKVQKNTFNYILAHTGRAQGTDMIKLQFPLAIIMMNMTEFCLADLFNTTHGHQL